VDDSAKVLPEERAARLKAERAARALAQAAAAPSHLIATVGRKTLGPFLARRGGVVLAAYLGASDSGERWVATMRLAAEGSPKGPGQIVAMTPSEATSFVLRATGIGAAAGRAGAGAAGAAATPGDDGAGFAAFWTALTDKGSVVMGAALDDEGALRAKPLELGRSADHILWVDAVPTARGALVFWAEETREGDANIVVLAMTADGRPLGVPARIARGANGWSAVPSPFGATLVLVEGRGGTSSLRALQVATDGQVRESSLVARDVRLVGRVETQSAGDVVSVAWTEQIGPEPRVRVASIDARGRASPPESVLDTWGANTLVGLAASADGIALAWEEPRAVFRDPRIVRVTAIRRGASGENPQAPSARRSPASEAASEAASRRTPVTAFEVRGGVGPELVPASDGFALLFPAHACEAKASLAACASSPVVPTIVRLDSEARVTTTVPIVLGSDRRPAALGWGLDCTAEPCLALAADGGTPTPISSVSAFARPTAWRAPLVPSPPAGAPELGPFRTVARGGPFDHLGVVEFEDGSLVAMLSAAEAGATPSGGASPTATPTNTPTRTPTTTSTRRDERPSAPTPRSERRGSPREPSRPARPKPAGERNERKDKKETKGRESARDRDRRDRSKRPAASEGDARRSSTKARDAAAAHAKGAPPRLLGGADPLGTIRLQPIDDRGEPLGAPVTVTTRALGAHGFAIAKSVGSPEGATVAWVAHEGGEARLHVARYDRRAKKVAETTFATVVGGVGDVALAPAEGGYVLAFVDGRDGNGEVYTTKLSPDLTRVSSIDRLTRAPGDASDLVAFARPEGVYLAWADARESPSDGFADIFLALLRHRDGHAAVTDTRLLASAAHSRSPVLAAGRNGGVAVGWIEEAPHGVSAARSSGYGAMFVQVDERGRPRHAPIRWLGAGDGAPTSIALRTREGAIEVALARSSPVGTTIDFGALGPDDETPNFYPLHHLEGPASLQTLLVLGGASLFVQDIALEQRELRRIRRAALLPAPR
jgi:hypothetical protein